MDGVVIVAEGEETLEDNVVVVPEGPKSPLGMLRGKREALDAALFLDLKVPRWDDQLDGWGVWVRYGPGNPNTFTAQMSKREKSHLTAVGQGRPGDPDWMTKANADMLVGACLAIFALPPGEEPPKGELPSGDYPTFSTPEFSQEIGAQPTAVATVLKLYGTSADVLLAATQLLNWSGQVSEEADRDFLGS